MYGWVGRGSESDILVKCFFKDGIVFIVVFGIVVYAMKSCLKVYVLNEMSREEVVFEVKKF